jgi:hypothetical protein
MVVALANLADVLKLILRGKPKSLSMLKDLFWLMVLKKEEKEGGIREGAKFRSAVLFFSFFTFSSL